MESKMEHALREAEHWWTSTADSLWKKSLEENKNHIANSFFLALESLKRDYQLLALQKCEGKMVYVCVSFLRSGLLLKRNTHKIELLDDQYFQDWRECGLMWDNYYLLAPVLDNLTKMEDRCKKYSSYKQYVFEQFILQKGAVLLLDFSDTLNFILQDNLERYKSIFPVSSQIVYGEYRDSMHIITRVD